MLDRFSLPLLGRRRGWLLVAQLLLAGSIVALGFSDPARHPVAMVASAMLVAFFSATQDVVVDAYRREDLADAELGLGSSLYVYGYRIGMWAASGGGADPGRPHPLRPGLPADGRRDAVRNRRDAARPGAARRRRPAAHAAGGRCGARSSDFFGREGVGWILAFILLYKVGDTMAAAIATPFYLELGFSKSEIGAVVKLFGSWATIGGAILGGMPDAAARHPPQPLGLRGAAGGLDRGVRRPGPRRGQPARAGRR